MAPKKEFAIKAAASTTIGAGAGAAAYGVIGGVGLAAGGTAVGVTLLPMAAIGATVGAAGFGIYRLGKKAGKASGKPKRR